jgi:predicted secreted Zn-dependent protease
MRRALLAAALLTVACGSSPEPAPPAPVPEPAAVDSDALRAAITAREQYYDIDGSSAGALRGQMRRLGPKDESGRSRDAMTVWDLEWTYRDVPVGDGCALQDVRVTLNVAITLPRWKAPATAPARLRESWRTYLEHLKLHEGGHRTIAERNARVLYAALLPLRAATCEELHRITSRTAEEIVAEGRARNRAYDVQTKHGQTQGVELRP